MPVFEIANFLTSIFYFYLAVVVFHRSPGRPRNRWGGAMLLAFALLTLFRFFLFRQNAPEPFLSTYFTGGVFFVTISAPVAFGFIMYFTQSFNRRDLYLIIITIVLFTIVHIAILCRINPQKELTLYSYGWFLKDTAGTTYAVGTAVYYFFAVRSLILLRRYAASTTVDKYHKESKMLFNASLASYILGLFADVVLPILTAGEVPPTAHFTSLIWAVILFRLILNSDLLADPDTILSRIPHELLVIDGSLNIIACNKTAEQTFKLNTGETTIKLTDLIREDDDRTERLSAFLTEQSPDYFQCRMLTDSSVGRNFRIQKSDTLGKNTESGSIILTLTDTDEYFTTITSLQGASRRNEFMIKEMHHRIKNNLQLVGSLISISELDSEDTRQLLENRIYAIQQAHESIYSTGNLTEVEAGEYLTSLLAHLSETFDHPGAISLHTELEDIKLPLKTATSLGILLNEIICNSYKYAFTDRENGSISVELSIENSRCRLCVSDNGTGRQNGVTQAIPSFGTELIEAMTQQLNGTLELSTENGYQYSISFPL